MWNNNRGRQHQSCGCQPWNEGPWRFEEPWKDCPSCNWQRGSWENRHGPWTAGPLGRRATPQFGPFWQRPSGPCPRCSHEYYNENSRCDECQECRDSCAYKRPGFAGPWHQDSRQQECKKSDRKNFTPAILFGLLWWVLFKRSNSNSWEDRERTETPGQQNGNSRHRGEYVHH